MKLSDQKKEKWEKNAQGFGTDKSHRYDSGAY